MSKQATPAGHTDLIDPGSPAPDFHLPDQSGKVHALPDYRGKWIVLYFYPRDNTPGCTREACQFRDSAARFPPHGAVVLGVSPDSEASHQKFAAKYDLPFPLLVDHDAKLCQAYGVWQQKSMYGRLFPGVVRTTYLIDPQGRVAHRWDKVSVTGHDEAVLEKLAESQ
jgi:peroxiredoxin Q/BCP